MLLSQIKAILNGTVIVEHNNNQHIEHAFATDLMSDALAMIEEAETTVLLTGLANMQTLRTAEMLDIYTIIFVRDKKADEEMIELAKKLHLNVYTTSHTMYEACGKLYQAGLSI